MGDLTTVDGLKAELVLAFTRGDAALAAALYEPGARLLPPGAPVITGEAAVREFFEKRLATGSVGGELERVRLDEFGDVTIEEGRYGRRSGDRLLDSGKYLAVFHRQPDGTWRWRTDIWNSDAAAPAE
jgi:ketosteroid isomerase-like protein